MSGISLSESTVFQGRYLILRKLGEGGMGSIYLAEQTDADRKIALKLLHPSLVENDEFKKRFIRECSNLSKLSNEHIITFYNAAVSDDGQPYAAFEYLCGITLRKACQDGGKLEMQRTVKILRQICSAIQAAHNAGIIHRDLKPENIMLLDKPEPDWVKVLDFGLSKESITDKRDAQQLTLTGDLVGTADYMSPEQCEGRKADTRSDFYALGCIAYECIAGKKLFEATNAMQLIHQHASQSAVPAINELSGICPPAMLQLLNELLQKDPDKRPQSIPKILEELQQIEEELRAGIITSQKLSNTQAKGSKKILYAAIACASVAIVAIGILGVISNQQSVQNQATAKKQTKKIGRQLQAAKDSARLADLIDEAKEAIRVGDYKTAADLCKKALQITQEKPSLMEWRLKTLIMLTQSVLTGQLGDAEPYLIETEQLLNSATYANAPISDQKKAKRKLDFLMNASVIYSQKGKYDKCLNASAEFKRIFRETKDDELRMLMSVLISESFACKSKGEYQRSIEIDNETLKVAKSVGATASDIMSTVYSSLMTTAVVLKKPHREVQQYSRNYADMFNESFPNNRFKTIMMAQGLSTADLLRANMDYFADGAPILDAIWDAAKSDTEIPLAFRTKALEQFLILNRSKSVKLKKSELTKVANEFLAICAEPQSNQQKTIYDASKAESAKLLQDLAKQAGDSSLEQRINLASKKL
ncbi:MAG: serine/threonine protein kinase [Candidatus Obscuribacterales bacterium]|jgi:serine/threonine protein kinase|nr:serine/threonine protein kinase [Candidatus Obscuribacterales bacterium]